MKNLLEVYEKCRVLTKELERASQQARQEYQRKIYTYDGEEYRVNYIDVTGQHYGYPQVNIQNVKEINMGLSHVKSKTLTIPEFHELINNQ